jgi:hypothetical protein
MDIVVYKEILERLVQLDILEQLVFEENRDQQGRLGPLDREVIMDHLD